MHDRYERREPLGRGHAGVVHVGVDRLLSRRIAIKTLHDLGGRELYWLKREFRCLAEFAHPNLVELYDLVVSDADCFFTMELVDGVDFLTRLRTDRGVDYDGLRDALAQLATGLSALHAQQKLHRDIKPQNVLVDAGGRVVILDFDLVLDTRDRHPAESDAISGTPSYMAPEQWRGFAATAASDWYAVGAMACEVLTGETPFGGSAGRRRAVLGQWDVPRASSVDPRTPADLDELVAALLHPVPASRAGAGEVLGILRGRSGGTVASLRDGAAPAARSALVGRHEELARLEAAFGSVATARTVSVEGAAGIGKTALIEHFLRGLEARDDVLVLRGRCHPRELVAFKALDAAIDDLHQFLVHQSDEVRSSLIDPSASVLARLFPVFADFYANAPAAGDEADSSREVRQRAFTALRELFLRVAGRTRVVLWLDDVHWTDRDSVALLRELRREPDAPPLFILLSLRPGHGDVADVLDLARDAELGLQPGHEWISMVLPPLGDEEARRVAQASAEGSAAAGVDLGSVVAEAAGNPLLLVELARHLPSVDAGEAAEGAGARLDAIVARRLREHSDEARRLLKLLAVSAGPVAEELVFLSGESPERTLAALAELRQDLLVRRVTRDQRPALDVFHARVRDAVLSTLEPEEVRDLHRLVLELLERSENPDALRLVDHYLGAGDTEAAGAFAFRVAAQLEAALAPDAAAAMYRKALDLGSKACPAWQLKARLGRCLVQAGRGGEGAQWLDAAASSLLETSTDDVEASRLQREAAEHYLRSGLHAEGLAMLRRVLASRRIFYPGSPSVALASLILNRMRTALAAKGNVGASAASASDREDLEVYWSTGVGLSLFDGIRAADFNARHALLSRRLGDVGHMARATASAAMILAWEGGGRRRERSREMIRAGRALAEASGNANVLAHALLMDGATALWEARWRDVVDRSKQVEDLCSTRCRGAAWELANAHVMRGNALACLGEMRRLREHMPEALRRGSERGDQYLLVTARIGHANLVWLASGRSDEARRQAGSALAGPFPPGYAWQVYQGALAIGCIELYEGRPREGWDHALAAVELMRRHYMLRFLPSRVEMLDLRARCALACAAQAAGDERKRMLAFAGRAARSIAREDAAWTTPFATLLEAGVAAGEARDREAAALYSAAASGFDSLHMRMHAWSARFAASRFGAALPADSDDWVKDQGIVEPAGILRVFAPGLGD